jgi:hypothetical protein
LGRDETKGRDETMTMYARIPPRKSRKNHPPPTRRYHYGGVTYRLDAEPDSKPRWYRIDDALAEVLADVRIHEDAPLIFEVITEAEWKRRIEKRVVVSVVDVEGGEKTAKAEKVSDGGSKSARSEKVAEDDGRVDVGKPAAKTAKKKAAKKKTAKKKTAKKKVSKRSSKKAPRATAPK